MPGRRGGGGGSYERFQERLRQQQADIARREQADREEQRREEWRAQEKEMIRSGREFLDKQDAEIAAAREGMTPWQREQLRMNDDETLRRYGIHDHRTTQVPSADERLDRIRKEAEEREAERLRVLERQRVEDLARREAVRQAADQLYRESMEALRQTQARIGIERWDSTRGNDYR